MNPDKLQPLRIPPGWQLFINDFYESDPDFDDNDESGVIWNFKEDIFHASNDRYIIDLGWYPEFKNEGSFVLKVISASKDKEVQIDLWQKPLFVFDSEVRLEVAAKLEQLLVEYLKIDPDPNYMWH